MRRALNSSHALSQGMTACDLNGHQRVLILMRRCVRIREGVMTSESGVRCLLGALVLSLTAGAGHAQNPPPPDHPAVTVNGKIYTPRSILARNMGTEADRYTA